MHLGVNGIRLTTPPSGVGRYIENVLQGWSGLSHPFDEVRVITPRPLNPDMRLPPGTRHVLSPARGPLWLWEQAQLPRVHGKKAILFCPSYVCPLSAKCPILLVHHGSYEGYPQAFNWWTRTKAYWAYRLSARRAEHIITVSQHSKRDMVRFYGVPEAKITVIPPGVNSALFRPIDDRAALTEFRRNTFGEDVPFILFVGKPARRRNIPALFAAYARLIRETPCRHRFLFIGSDLPGCPVKRLARQMGLEQQIAFKGQASHETIALACNASSLLVYPSSYEGFGLPVLEAMACGTPAIALRNTAFLEFAEGAALLAEDAEPDTLLAAMDRMLNDAPFRDGLRKVGIERARAYDWKYIAERTMSVLTGMLNGIAA